jgi:hypothetical protein
MEKEEDLSSHVSSVLFVDDIYHGESLDLFLYIHKRKRRDLSTDKDSLSWLVLIGFQTTECFSQTFPSVGLQLTAFTFTLEFVYSDSKCFYSIM